MDFTDIKKDSVICPKEVAQRRIAEKKGNAHVEFFNIWRANTEFDKARQRYIVGKTGIPMQNPDGGAIKFYKFLPTVINYKFWVWSHSLNNLNKCAERYMFWLYNNPKLDLLIDDQYTISNNILFSDYSAEHTVGQQYDKGTIYVYSFELMLEAWILDFSSDAVPADSPIVKSIHLDISDDSKAPNYVELYSDWVFRGDAKALLDEGDSSEIIFVTK